MPKHLYLITSLLILPVLLFAQAEQQNPTSASGLFWRVTGNAGTSPAVNHIGTNDANDFVVKTGGTAAINERMRYRSTGNVIVNNTGFFAGDVFSVYANNTTNGTTGSINNTVGTFAVNGYSSGSGTGVYGEVNGGASTAGTAVWGNMFGTNTTASSTSEGVWGTNSTSPLGTGVTAGVASAVRGEATGAAGTAFTMGVLGVNIATAGAAYGMYGQTSSAAAMGVFGINLSTAQSPAHGIQGQTAAVGSAAGIRGFNTAATFGAGQNGFGVRGTANGIPSGTGFAIGVRGDVSASSGSTYGIFGQAASPDGFGAYSFNSNTNGTGAFFIGNNVVGTFLGAGAGVAATGSTTGAFIKALTAASGVGVLAVGNNAANLIPAVGCGVSGVGAQYGVVGYATTTVNTNPNNNSASNAANASSGGYFEVQSAGTAQTWAYVAVRDNGSVLRKIIGPGTVNTVVADIKNPSQKVVLSCPEAPENLFMDYGKGKLENGKAHVTIDPQFAASITVTEKHPLRVFIQPEGDCKGVFVTNKSVAGFDVIELEGGKSSIEFMYTVIGNRADEVNPDGTIARYSEERFVNAPGPLQTTVAESKKAAVPTLNEPDDKPALTPEVLLQAKSKKNR